MQDLFRFSRMLVLCLSLAACTGSGGDGDSSDNSEKTNQDPEFTIGVNFSVDENSSFVVTASATDADGDTLTYSLNGGADQGLFTIDPSTATLSFLAPPDFEAPADSDTDNIYRVRVKVSDGKDSQNILVSVRVDNVNDNSPSITSATAMDVEENGRFVQNVSATDGDGDTIVYRLSGGADQALFSINAVSGALSFVDAPDFELPADSNADNEYQLEVSASDGSNSVSQALIVTVTDLNEAVYGLDTRPTNATCSIPDPPSASADIRLTRVFTNLSFSSPVVLRQSPVSVSRWYVAEQGGRIRTFLENDAVATVFADLRSRISTAEPEMGLLGMAFHPNFTVNGYVYVYYSAPGGPQNHQTVVSRFNASSDTSLNLSSELEILRFDQPYGNHNGGNILFGPDGYLYIGTGDGGSAGDPGNYAQDPSSLLGKMLRIDVDTPANGNNYSSPADNPYVGIAGRDEIFALGLRNPWRWSFDRVTGDLIAGDVGQDAWEEIDVITRGGNYGWRCYEGNHAYDTAGCRAQGSYQAPVHEYDRGDGFSVTGGYVYRGGAIPGLIGTYIYTDYGPGWIWGLSDPTGTNPVNTELLSYNAFVSSFAEDSDGELYLLNFSNGRVYRIDPDTGGGSNSFPGLLSETGCIDGINPLQMAAGLIPYEINAPFWSDGAEKQRWMALEDGSTITIGLDDDWTFPNNSVLVKNFELNGKRIETRLLVRHADGSWGGYSYEWNDGETDASLVLGGKVAQKQGQTYVFPSSTDCMICHTTVAGVSLGPETGQLNRDLTYPSTGLNANQLETLEHIGMFSAALPDLPENLPMLTDPGDSSADLHDRARAYLYTNCSQCHRFGGPTGVSLDFDIDTPDIDMNVCDATPSYFLGGASKILAPGNASDSTLYRRLNCRPGVAGCSNGDEMPPLGSTLVDTSGASLISSWINGFAACP